MDIQVKAPKLPELIQTLGQFPTKTAQWILRNSIKVALSSGRTQIDRAVRSRSNIRQQTVLRAIGRPYVSGITGVIHSFGARLKAQDFDPHESRPYGVEVEYIKGAPAYLKKAFYHGKGTAVLQRIGESRFPVQAVAAPFSVPEAISQRKDVMPKIEAGIEEKLYSELNRLISLTLSGFRANNSWGS